MKTLLTLATALVLGLQPVWAQEDLPAEQTKHNALKLVPQQFIAKTFQLDYERALSPKTSLQFSPSVTAGTNVLDNDYEEITGGGLEVTAKFYVGTRYRPLEGFYAGLSGSYHHYSMKDPEFLQFDPATNAEVWSPGRAAKVKRFSTNVTFGYQFIIQQIVALDVYAGGGLRIGNSDEAETQNPFFEQNGIFNYKYTGVAPKVGFSVGILF